MYSWCTRKVVFPLLALTPPVALALATNSLEFLVGITGSYAGAGIQYVVPALLAYTSRKATAKAIGIGVTNHHRSWFKSTFWVILVTFGPLDVLFWSLGTTYNQQSTKANYEKTRKNPTQIQLQRLESTKINYEKAEQI